MTSYEIILLFMSILIIHTILYKNDYVIINYLSKKIFVKCISYYYAIIKKKIRPVDSFIKKI